MSNIAKGSIQTTTVKDSRFNISVDTDSQFVGFFHTDDGTSIQIFNDTYCFGKKDFIIEIIGSNGIITYQDSQGLKYSQKNDIPPTAITVDMPLSHLGIGSSIISSSVPYLIKAVLDTDKTLQKDLPTLKQSKQTIQTIQDSARTKLSVTT